MCCSRACSGAGLVERTGGVWRHNSDRRTGCCSESRFQRRYPLRRLKPGASAFQAASLFAPPSTLDTNVSSVWARTMNRRSTSASKAENVLPQPSFPLRFVQ